MSERTARLLLIGLTGLLACGASLAADPMPGETMVLTLPHPAASGEMAAVVVRTGPLARGTEIEIDNREGMRIGSIEPFGVPIGGVLYTFPLPPSAIANNQVELRLKVTTFGAGARSPKPGEVEGVNLIYVPIAR